GGLLYDRKSNSLFVSELGLTVQQQQQSFNGELIKQYNANGTLINTLGAGTGQSGRAGMAMDQNQNLYVGTFDFFTGAPVFKFNKSDNYATPNVFGTGVYGDTALVLHNQGILADAIFGYGASTGAITKLNADGSMDPANPFA